MVCGVTFIMFMLAVGASLNPRTGRTRNGTKTEQVFNAPPAVRGVACGTGRLAGLTGMLHGYRHCCCGRETVGKASL